MNKYRPQLPGRQRGVIVVATTVAMLALLLVAGYSFNSGHLLLNKTRLQNIVDAAALSAAKVLDQSHDTLLAQQAGFNTLTMNLAEAGYEDLADSITGNGIAFSAEFSNTLVPFVPGSLDPRFVRISLAANAPLDDLFISMGGQKAVNASAISGPSPPLVGSACDLAPMMACGEDTLECEGDTCSNYYGYEPGQYTVMKYAAGDSSDVGAGNFQLIRLDDSQGGADVRENMAGGYEGCLATSDVVETEPGNTVGPVVQGLNTRFGSGGGGGLDTDLYQADYVTDFGSSFSTDANGEAVPPADGDVFDYSDYQTAYGEDQGGIIPNAVCPGGGRCHRRMLTIPIGNCSGTTNGQGQVPLYGFACLYLLQPVNQQGNEAQVYGQFVQGCTSYGSFSQDPTTGPAPTRIILYKDPGSEDS
ncbi:pilus assembly protein [Aestuariicella hydrocarbonica]|uniref:Pilus assembly protein n=1 Tax=Pseudomaricurvus hydrocarbonicus TaxID=1470433 RepID=A0A9E5MMU8_9GAMM|nr:pilus assembly protein TadG-related protein [Aestuariicella hydrocarbonica]NHO67151.1 pilus assembly protein [Aestuariicella hydrocarbonica]